MEYKIIIEDGKLNDLIVALNYFVDKYDLYKKEEIVSSIKVLRNDIIYQLYEQKILRRKFKKVDLCDLGSILEDFVSFVCEQKGHKIGVGYFLIQKYLLDIEFYNS